MIYSTHIYDILGKLTACVIGVIFSVILDGIISNNWLAIGIGTCFVGGLWIFIFRPLSSLLYARFDLRTKLSFAQAKRASVLFSPVMDMTKWYPMTHVIPILVEEDRAIAIMTAVVEIEHYYKVRQRQWRKAPVEAKITRLSLWIFFLIITVSTFFLGRIIWLISTLICGIFVNCVLLNIERKLGIQSIVINVDQDDSKTDD